MGIALEIWNERYYVLTGINSVPGRSDWISKVKSVISSETVIPVVLTTYIYYVDSSVLSLWFLHIEVACALSGVYGNPSDAAGHAMTLDTLQQIIVVLFVIWPRNIVNIATAVDGITLYNSVNSNK